MCKDPPPISWRGVVYNPELTTSEGISPLVIRKCAAQINGVSRFSNGNLHSLEGYLHEYYSAESRTHIVPATFHFSFRRNITCNLQELKRKKKRELSGFSFSRLDTSIMCLFRPSLRKQCPNFVQISFEKKEKGREKSVTFSYDSIISNLENFYGRSCCCVMHGGWENYRRCRAASYIHRYGDGFHDIHSLSLWWGSHKYHTPSRMVRKVLPASCWFLSPTLVTLSSTGSWVYPILNKIK
jgi:hypothetical protein